MISSEAVLAMISVAAVLIGKLYYGAGGGGLPWNVDVTLMALPFFTGGYLLKKHNTEMLAYLKKHATFKILLLGAVNLISGYMSYRYSGERMDMFWNSYGCLLANYIAAFAGILFIIAVCIHVRCKVICYIGENSMIYFAWHQTMMMPVVNRMMKYCGMVSDGVIGKYFFIIIELLIIVLMLTLMNELLLRSKLRFILKAK